MQILKIDNREMSYQFFGRHDIRALESVGSKLGLSDVVYWLIARQRKTAGMAAILPIAFKAGDSRSVHRGC